MVSIYFILSIYIFEVYLIGIRSIVMVIMYMVIEIFGLVIFFGGEYLLFSSINWLYFVVWVGVFLLQSMVVCGLLLEIVGKVLKDLQKEILMEDVVEIFILQEGRCVNSVLLSRSIDDDLLMF